MKNTITCDQLFVNDTNCDPILIDSIISTYLPSTLQSVIVSKEELLDNLSVYGNKFDGTTILPGSGSLIAQRLLSISSGDILYLPSVRRRLAPGSMSPRGIEIDEQDIDVLSGVGGSVRIVDDVVASGSTINGIYKRLTPIVQKNASLVTLILRNPTDLASKIPLSFGIKVSSSNSRYPRINTLSTLETANSKRSLVLEGRTSIYGAGFAKEMSELFTL